MGAELSPQHQIHAHSGMEDEDAVTSSLASQMVSLNASPTSDGYKIKIMYLEGFSPGPGLPYPLLNNREFEVIAPYMPYGCREIVLNPFVIAIVLVLAAHFVFLAVLVRIWWVWLLSTFGLLFFLRWLKRKAVARCLKECVAAFKDAVVIHKPDILIGYSWGGGIAAEMVSKGLWKLDLGSGLSHVRVKMWKHAGLPPPSLSNRALSPLSRILTVQGGNDVIVRLKSVKKLHRGSRRRQCRLLIAESDDHMLRFACTKVLLLTQEASGFSERLDQAISPRRSFENRAGK
eukprot:jgi/Bigna1/74277/fgenesh1_pg.28_\